MQDRYASIGFRAFLISFLCIIGVSCIVAGITYSLELWGGKTIPDVAGMTQQEAEDLLASKGFNSEIERIGSDEQKGTTLGTDPNAGVRAETSTRIIIYVAKPKSVPNVCGMMIDEARSVLSENGYENIEVVEKASDEKQGKVLSQDPTSNSRAQSDTLISLTVASPHTVPDVKGMSEAEAKSAIANAGYKYFVTKTYSDDVSQGCVVETLPSAGETLSSNSTVEIKIAKSKIKELEETARKYLESLSKVNINGKSYEISQIDDISYDQGSTCKFTLTVRPFESHSWFGGEPETRYGNYEKIDGALLINDKNEVESTNPEILPI